MSADRPQDGGGSERFEDELPAESLLARLPAGRHGLPRSFVAQNQRLRICAAMLRVLPRRGYALTTIGDVTGEASVSRAAFYAQFGDKEACFLATYDLAVGWFCNGVQEAVAEEDRWPDRVRAGTAAALRLLGSNPLIAHLVAVEAPQAGRAARERQRETMSCFAAVLRADHPGRPEAAGELADLLLGGIVSQIARYVDAGRAERLPEATRAIVEFLLLPYMGAEETRLVLKRLPDPG